MPRLGAIKLTLDWPAYFRQFSETHMGTPVIYHGRQLFQDGWMYSASDYAGPEWPPPDDPMELKELIKAYWLIRVRKTRQVYKSLKENLDNLQAMQRARGVPLQAIVVYTDSENKRKTDRVPVDYAMLRQELAFVAQELLDSTDKLREALT